MYFHIEKFLIYHLQNTAREETLPSALQEGVRALIYNNNIPADQLNKLRQDLLYPSLEVHIYWYNPGGNEAEMDKNDNKERGTGVSTGNLI